MMIVGVGLISTVSATIASGLIQVTRREKRKRVHRQAQDAVATQADPHAPAGSTELPASQYDPDSQEFQDDPAAATLALLVAAIDRLQTEVMALRSGREMSDATVTNVTVETPGNPGESPA
jgi:hypothetical protein